jgi:hypothetical protein
MKISFSNLNEMFRADVFITDITYLHPLTASLFNFLNHDCLESGTELDFLLISSEAWVNALFLDILWVTNFKDLTEIRVPAPI